MASFFGEVRYQVSRAYDEEDDDSPGIRYDVQIEMEEELEGKIRNVEAVLISYGSLVTDFCETLVLSEQCKEVGRIHVRTENDHMAENTGDFHPRKPVPSRLYLTPTSMLVCCVSKDVNAAAATQFAQKLLSLTNQSSVVMVLSSHHSDALKGNYNPQGEENCVIHSLRCPAFPYTPAYPHLPQPAILCSVPAAVLTECVVGQRPCVAYPVFTETFSTGDLDLVAEALLKVFVNKPFQKYFTSELDTKKLNKYRSSKAQRENLDLYL